jgi:hypothetical protein
MVGDKVTVEGFEITVLEVEEQRIVRVRVARGVTKEEIDTEKNAEQSAELTDDTSGADTTADMGEETATEESVAKPGNSDDVEDKRGQEIS